MGAVSNVLPAQRGLYVIIGAKLSRFQSRLRVYNIYGVPRKADMAIVYCMNKNFRFGNAVPCGPVTKIAVYYCYDGSSGIVFS